ncbi:hypothetical protein JZ751_015359, partial [Albula glossodonta]
MYGHVGQRTHLVACSRAVDVPDWLVLGSEGATGGSPLSNWPCWQGREGVATAWLHPADPLHLSKALDQGCSDKQQKLRNKGLNDCASPEGDDSFGHCPLVEDRLGKLSQDSDVVYKRCGALNKKEHRGCDSPDPDSSFVLTPHTEEKYKKINEEFDNMMRNHKIPSALPQQSFSMHVAVPVSNPGALSYTPSGSLGGAQALGAVAASLGDGGLLSPPQSSLHRNVGSPGGPQRPPSAGST